MDGWDKKKSRLITKLQVSIIFVWSIFKNTKNPTFVIHLELYVYNNCYLNKASDTA